MTDLREFLRGVESIGEIKIVRLEDVNGDGVFDKSILALQKLNALGYGLTLGIHSRIQSFVDDVVREARVGNIYVNRSMIGAVVGVQPFGGEGLSGTGPKAGGPHYVARFATERVTCIDTTAAGGNATLMAGIEG